MRWMFYHSLVCLSELCPKTCFGSGEGCDEFYLGISTVARQRPQRQPMAESTCPMRMEVDGDLPE